METTWLWSNNGGGNLRPGDKEYNDVLSRFQTTGVVKQDILDLKNQIVIQWYINNLEVMFNKCMVFDMNLYPVSFPTTDCCGKAIWTKATTDTPI